MKLAQALELEIQRQKREKWDKIYLHKDGKFFRAYEWSAWLIKTIACTEEFQKERGDPKMLTANRYKTKNNDYVCVGFPLESLSKYMPKFKDVDYATIEDYMEFDLKLENNPDLTYEDIKAHFDNWKDTLQEKEVTKSSSKTSTVTGSGSSSNENIATATGKDGIFSIVSQILSYPIESSSLIDNLNFLMKLRSQLSALL